MQIPANRWHNAIQTRHSRRKYLSTKPIPQDILQNLDGFCKSFRPFGDAAYGVLVTDSPENIFLGSIGSYGIITGAPAYMAFIGDTRDAQVDEKVGYTGEGLILEATALGLNTCWVGGFFKPEAVRRHLSLTADERVFAVTPVGYTSEQYRPIEKLMSSLARSRQRKPLEKLCSGLAASSWAEWQKTALLAAQLAPSAVNRQPWHFQVDPAGITVLIDQQQGKNPYKRLDCGIALLHLQAGAEQAGVKGQISLLEHTAVGRFEMR